MALNISRQLIHRSASSVGSNAVIIRQFHHQNVIQFHIQQDGNKGASGGILLEALQNVAKTRVRVSSVAKDFREQYYNFQVPDELHRLKYGGGSFKKLLFEIWLSGGSKKNYSALTTIKKALGQQSGDDDEAARKVVSKNQKFLRTASEQQLFDVLDYLKANDIAIRRLIRLPWLLTSDPENLETSTKRVQKLLNLKSFKVAISFANQNDLKLLEVAGWWKMERKLLKQLSLAGQSEFENRLEYLAYRLRCQEEDVSDMMSRCSNLMLVPLQNLEAIVTCLTDSGVKSEWITSDPWVFSYNPQSVKSRALQLTQNGISDFKPWVFRSPQRIFDKFIAKRMEQKELLGQHTNIQGFLQERLQCSEQQASGMLKKVPSIKTATAIKLNEMIEFLLSAGFTPEQIKETPRILAHSVETISDRLQEINAYSKRIQNLQVLCRTAKDYRAILRKMKRDAKAVSAAYSSSSIKPTRKMDAQKINQQQNTL